MQNMLPRLFLFVLSLCAFSFVGARSLARQEECTECNLVPAEDSKFQDHEQDRDSSDKEIVLRARRIPNWAFFANSPEDVSSERMIHGMSLKHLDAAKKRNDGTNLSIVNPVEVLRQRMLIDAARERQNQIDANAEMLREIGKRQPKAWWSDWH